MYCTAPALLNSVWKVFCLLQRPLQSQHESQGLCINTVVTCATAATLHGVWLWHFGFLFVCFFVFFEISAYISIVFLSPDSLSSLPNNVLSAGKPGNTACLWRRFQSQGVSATDWFRGWGGVVRTGVGGCVRTGAVKGKEPGFKWTKALMWEDGAGFTALLGDPRAKSLPKGQ